MRCVSNTAQGVRPVGLTPWVLFVAVALVPLLAVAHPTPEEIAERAHLRTLCSREPDAGKAFDPVELGAEEADLRAAWGDALRAGTIEHLAPDFYRLAPKPEARVEKAQAAEDADPYAGQLRLQRTLAEGEIRSVEYELYRGRVYRIRWELSERFHAPIMENLVHQASHCYGPPEYDQTIEALIASGEATRRRAGWRRDGRLLEIRQLNPLLGGPVFVTVTDMNATQKIIEARGTVAPEPERRPEPWWKRANTRLHLPDHEERDALAREFAALLSQSDF